MARLQRAVRPSAGYARSLAVLARAKNAGLTTKSGMILGMGEDVDEVVGALADLRAVGVDIVTLGQYLRPTAAHLPVARWWTPEEFESLRAVGEEMGFAHVESSPADPVELPRPEAAAAAAATAAATAATAARRRRRLRPTGSRRERAGAAPGPSASERVRARMEELGVDALLLSHGADLPWLTGYRAMPLERLTLLVLPREGEPVLLVPALEAPRVPDTRRDWSSLRPWAETEDPVALAGGAARHRRPGATFGISRPGVGHTRCWPCRPRLPEARVR